ncbi:uncharacterized protein LOC133718078 [Rosa rugosa]|uniref:uncharacterized protein LOC133718078 n=1 Tax=Rosa rugosa TaxID=74645 RepID=UPI002B414C86|nr:uncharacterized protein LOC133718078 [Rosa rugosa]
MIQIRWPGHLCEARPSGMRRHLIEGAVATCSLPPLSLILMNITNLIKESIRMGYNDFGDFHYSHGNLGMLLRAMDLKISIKLSGYLSFALRRLIMTTILRK